MHAKIFSASVLGIESCLIEVEADLSHGLVNFCIVGLPDKAVKESKDRIRAALKNSGLSLPERLITVNLAPADLKKQDALFDVPIAIAILQASGKLELSQDFLNQTVFLGELALSGEIRPGSGVISIACKAKQFGKKRVILPAENSQEAALCKDLEVIGVQSLYQLYQYLKGEIKISPTTPVQDNPTGVINFSNDLSQVLGQAQAKQALEIAAVGWHNLIFIGPPGTGKTMLAQRLVNLLPDMPENQALETTKIYSVSGALKEKTLMRQRPFRAPHQTVSQAGLVGGGSPPRPGEISLAHNGVLFLDELAEFRSSSLEALRQPIESKKVLISRASFSTEFPCNFLLVCATNPCPCGFFGSAKCVCAPVLAQKYIAKLSGPFLDRIDLHVRVNSIKYEHLAEKQAPEESTEVVRARVQKAVEFVKARQGSLRNSELNPEQIDQICKLTPEAKETLKNAFQKLSISARGYHKILRLARTVADIRLSPEIDCLAVKRAINFRFLDKNQS